MRKFKIIIGGFIGLLPIGGVTWDYIQYPLGFQLMGHDVYYIEDTRLYPIYQSSKSKWNDASGCVTHLKNVMESFGMKGKWAYRDEASGKSYGMSETKIKEICEQTDIFINISCSVFLREEYLKIPVRILVDSDPMFTQIQYASSQMFTQGKSSMKEVVDAHSHHFTFGENVGKDGCRIPECGIHWKPTRQPICTKFWEMKSSLGYKPTFSTLMNWAAGKLLNFDGETWGQKDIEFLKVENIPEKIDAVQFTIVVNQTGGIDNSFHKMELENKGWNILTSRENADDWKTYRQFISKSSGEFSVAKETYVKSVSGWFSCRSACYLAAGKPVVTQDTGWSKFIENGKGLFAFNNQDEAIDAVNMIMKDYQAHSDKAREIALGYFGAERVLTEMLYYI